MRQHTKLQDAKLYDSDFDKTTFIELYPFLPAHFEILLRLLGALAKSTGGVGLRSAIKVVQDVLVEAPSDRKAVAEQTVGWLATTVTIYDSLEKDIHRAFPSTYKAVSNVLRGFRDSAIHQEVAKTVAVLQILGNLPVTISNIAALMHEGIEAPSRKDKVEAAVADLIRDPHIPFGEQDGNLQFFSEKLNDIEQERAQIPLRAIESRRIHNEALRDLFAPLPSIRLHGSLLVTAGLKAAVGSSVASLAGERETIQTIAEGVDPKEYDTARTRLVDESRQRSSQSVVYLLARTSPEIDDKVAEIYRCREITVRHRSEPDQEVKDYCRGQSDRAERLKIDLMDSIKRSQMQGSFIFRGQTTAVNSLDQDLLEASKKHLETVAKEVFDRYSEAPVRAETVLAEKFLRVGNLKGITSQIDPLGLVQVVGGTPQVKVKNKALVSIHDYVERNGNVEGKRLLEVFTDAPYGWSQDTLRYLVAALLVAGEIKLKVSGREVTVNGQQAIEALKNNTSFKSVGVALRVDKVSNEVLSRAATRLTELLGDQILPLEDEISKAAAKQFPQFQHKFAPLAERLAGLGLAGAETIRSCGQEIADCLLSDASDAPQRLGGDESALFNGLKWATQVDVAMKQGLESTIRDLQQHRRDIEALPASGIPGQLRADLVEELALLDERLKKEDFVKHAADFRSMLTAFQARARDAALQMADAQKNTIKQAEHDLQRLPAWIELTQEEQSKTLPELDELLIDPAPDLAGLKQLLGQEYVIGSKVGSLRKQIEQLAHQRQLQRLEEEKAKLKITGKTKLTRNLTIPAALTTAAQLESLITQLQELKLELALYTDIEITIQFEK